MSVLRRNIPRSIAIAVPIITGLYVFMNLAYMTVLTPHEMMTAPAGILIQIFEFLQVISILNLFTVAVLFGERILGPMAFLIPLGVALATFGCALSIQFGVTRMCFVAGQEGHMMEPLSYVHVKKSTPGPAVALQGIIAFIFIVVGNIHTLIEFASFLIWFFYGSAMVALLVMRKTHAKVHRPYKVPLIFPIFTLLVAIFLSVFPIIADPSLKYLFAVGFILSGVAVYVPFVYYGNRPQIMDKLSEIVQLLFVAVPPETAPKE